MSQVVVAERKLWPREEGEPRTRVIVETYTPRKLSSSVCVLNKLRSHRPRQWTVCDRIEIVDRLQMGTLAAPW